MGIQMKIRIEDLCEAACRFPQGSEVRFSDGMATVITTEPYGGECYFDLFAETVPDWTKPDSKQ
jgi:hypothetical protein